MADFLEDDESGDLSGHNFGHKEWDKLEENFVNAGYREGITAGKEEALQDGFNDGFALHGAPLGRDVGALRGTAAACLLFVHRKGGSATSPIDSKQDQLIDEITSIIRGLAALSLLDLIPPDMEALEHAKDHVNAGKVDAVVAVDSEVSGAQKKWETERGKLEDLRTRLKKVLVELDVSIDV